MRLTLRAATGAGIGAAAGLLAIAVAVLAKPPFLADTPRSEHPLLLVLMVAVPALIGLGIGLWWRGLRA